MDKFTRTNSGKLGLLIALFISFTSIGQSVDQYKTTTASGSINAYTIPNADFGAYRVNEKWLVDFTGVTTNSGAATINRAGLGAKSIKMPDGTDVTSGTLIGRVQLSYNGTVFYVVGGSGSGGGGTWGSITGTLSSQTDLQSALDSKLSTTLTAGHFYVGNVSNVATDVAMSGDATLSSAGALSIGSGKVTNTMLAGSIAASKLVGTDIATVGTITTGVWNGTAIANANLANSTISGISLGSNLANLSIGAELISGGATTYNGSSAKTLAIQAGSVTNTMLAGSIAASKLVGTDIATVGTITSGTWNGTKLSEVYGGTNQSTYATGDILYANASNTLAKLAIGSSGNVLTVSGGIPSWAPAGSTLSNATSTSAGTSSSLWANSGYNFNIGANANVYYTISTDGMQTWTTGSVDSVTPTAFNFAPGGITNAPASTEITDFMFDANRRIHLTAGNYNQNRTSRILGPNFGATGAMTIKEASTLSLTPPSPNSIDNNVTITKPITYNSESGAIQAINDAGTALGGFISSNISNSNTPGAQFIFEVASGTRFAESGGMGSGRVYAAILTRAYDGTQYTTRTAYSLIANGTTASGYTPYRHVWFGDINAVGQTENMSLLNFGGLVLGKSGTSIYRTTNTGGDGFAGLVVDSPNATFSTAGQKALIFDNGNQLGITLANGTRRILGGYLQLVNTTTTAGLEVADIGIGAKSSGAAAALVATFSSTNNNVSLKHLKGSTSAPSISAGAGAGTSPTVSVTGTDLSGYITVTTGTSPTAATTVATITFNTTYSSTPTVAIAGANDNAVLLTVGNQVYSPQSGWSTTQFTIIQPAGAAALAASTTYIFRYTVFQ